MFPLVNPRFDCFGSVGESGICFFSHGPVNEARRCGPMLRRSSSGETGSLPLRLKVVMACHGYGVRYRQVFSHNMTSRFSEVSKVFPGYFRV